MATDTLYNVATTAVACHKQEGVSLVFEVIRERVNPAVTKVGAIVYSKISIFDTCTAVGFADISQEFFTHSSRAEHSNIPASRREGFRTYGYVPAGRREGFRTSEYVPAGQREGFRSYGYIPAGRREGFRTSEYVPAGQREGFRSAEYVPASRREGFRTAEYVPASQREGFRTAGNGK